MSSSRVPRRFVFIDTEAHRRSLRGVETQKWRLGVSAEVNWDTKAMKWSVPVFTEHQSPTALWVTITDAARPNARTVVVAHNLAYDLRISDAFRILGELGWSLEKITLSHGHVGFDAVKDHCRLVVVDSLTVLPRSIEELGKILELTKPKLPKEDDPDAVHYQRCRADVEILMKAYLIVVDELRGRDLGCWARTGSGIAWNTFTRNFLSDKVLVHERDDIRALEHASSYGGRAEAWQWGRLRKGRWTEWDFALAYANVLAEESLPAYLYDTTGPISIRHIRKTYGPWRWLVTAKVTLEAPVLPVTDAHGVFYPTGSFEGTWWDCELLAAIDAGAEVEVLSTVRYKGAKWLETWANWVIDAVADDSSPEARIFGIAAKHWQRSLVGRSSMRFRAWDEVGPAWLEGVSYMPLADLDAGTFGACLQVNGRRWEAWERTWWDNALPQLLSSVIAHCRVNLWQAMNVAGLSHVVYVDTDALITDAEGTKRLEAATAAGTLGSLRKKHVMTRLDIWAPRYVNAPGYSRIAGVSRTRTQTGEHTYEGEVWERLPEALASGHASSVIVSPVSVELTGQDWHRVHLPDGSTAAYEVAGGARVPVEVTALAG
jgi:hypothetical protein